MSMCNRFLQHNFCRQRLLESFLPKAGGDGEKLDNTDKMAFSVGVKKSVSSNGSIGVAFQGVTNSGNLASVKGVPNDDKEYKNFVWAIPVAIEVAF